MHAHVAHPRVAKLFVQAARTYAVDRVFAISLIDDAEALRKEYGDYFYFWYRLPFEEKDDPALFKKLSLQRIKRALDFGCIGIKFWFKPQFNYEARMRFDDPRLRPVFEAMSANHLPALVHVADPDVWFEKVYTNRAIYGTKQENYTQLTNVLREFPGLTVVGAHMAGDPEHLDHLQDLLDTHPNLVLDCSATKWMARELRRDISASRDFFIRNADRIMFGTDLVTFEEISDFDRYASRYWVHQVLWETDIDCESPIDDDDCEGTPRISGLNLPVHVLEKLYWQNAVRVFRIPKPPVLRSSGVPV